MKEVIPRLHDILNAVNVAQEVLQNVSIEDYCQNPTLQPARFACERAVEIVSEASRHIPDELKQHFLHISWQAVASIGNKLRHEYNRLDDRIIYEVITRHFPVLEEAVKQMLSMLNSGE